MSGERLTERAPWQIERQGKTVHAIFRGFLDGRSGEASAAEFERATRALDEFRLILDVRAMDGYANEARQAWGRVIRERRRAIVAVETVGASAIVRMGASLLGMLAGVIVEHRSG